MPDNLFHDHYRIPSARAVWHNYNGGVYFVTICTQGRKHFFGEIADGKMQLSAVGQFAEEQLQNVAKHYAYAQIPSWVVMPNHVHAIVVIDGWKTPYEKRNVERAVETFHETSLQHTPQKSPIEYATQMQSWLSVVVRQFKQSVTRFATQNHIPFAWQTRFHDRIIRNHDEMNLVAEYVENNVARWESDKFYT